MLSGYQEDLPKMAIGAKFANINTTKHSEHMFILKSYLCENLSVKSKQKMGFLHILIFCGTFFLPMQKYFLRIYTVKVKVAI